jgi:hypothetical protein
VPLLIVSVPIRKPGYAGVKVIGTVQVVPDGLLAPPTVQPVTVPTVNSCAPLASLGTVMLLMTLAVCSWNWIDRDADVEPIEVAGKPVWLLAFAARWRDLLAALVDRASASVVGLLVAAAWSMDVGGECHVARDDGLGRRDVQHG